MDAPKFVIEAQEAESMAKTSGFTSVLQLLPTLVKLARTLARPPISNYHVGAVGLGSDGRIFLGVNLEFPGLPLNQTVHAEQFLLTNLSIHSCPALDYLAVSAAPCGHCRQFLQEFRHSSDLQILITSDQNPSQASIFRPLVQFLSDPFGPSDLLSQETPLMLEKHSNGLSFLDSNGLCLWNGVDKGIDGLINGDLSNGVGELNLKNETMLKIAALDAANGSHAPYSGCPSGVALMDCYGKIYKGSYMESAAYNPSLGPVQAALIAYLVGSGGGGYDKMVYAVLVETEGAVVMQEDTARLIIKTVSPKCEFRVFHCRSMLKKCKKASS